MTRWAGLALILLGVLAVALALRGPKGRPRPQEPIMPAGGVCSDCDKGVPLTTSGRCAVCGSSSVVLPWSHGAKLSLRDIRARQEAEEARERKRFRRGGIAS